MWINPYSFPSVQEMSQEIVAHAADLRYLSYPVKTYMEEAKVGNIFLYLIQENWSEVFKNLTNPGFFHKSNPS